ncbi:MAG: hypothetical protein ABEH47_03615 [Haloferacaceae archaeon]
MHGECYFCHGPVSGFESDHIILDGHADHDVYMHERCAAGHDVLEPGTAEVTCPECGAVETP